MIRGRCTLTAAVAVTAVSAGLGACTSIGDGVADPCAGMATCLRLDVDSPFIETLDQLELDVVYAGVHATTTTTAVGGPIHVPFSTSLAIDLPDNPTIQVDLVAGAKLGGALLGASAASTTIQQGTRNEIVLFLERATPCNEGGVYCGGTMDIFAEPQTLYRCTGGLPIFYARCSLACSPHFDDTATCFGGGLCRDGGTYCGGDLLDGDPNTLYVCSRYVGTAPVRCANRCVINGNGNDACQ